MFLQVKCVCTRLFRFHLALRETIHSIFHIISSKCYYYYIQAKDGVSSCAVRRSRRHSTRSMAASRQPRRPRRVQTGQVHNCIAEEPHKVQSFIQSHEPLEARSTIVIWGTCRGDCLRILFSTSVSF